MILNFAYLKEEADKCNITIDSEKRILNENYLCFSKSDSKKYDIFLSHSSIDKQLVLALLELFNEAGYSVHVDWIDDKQLDRDNVSKATAQTLKDRMQSSRSLSYLTTSNSTKSKWCPWELG